MESGALPMVELGSMRQQMLVRDATDDWTGVTDAAGRRRLQNRLNQRAYRQRKGRSSAKSLGTEKRTKSVAASAPDEDHPPFKIEDDDDRPRLSKTYSMFVTKKLLETCPDGHDKAIERIQSMEDMARQAYMAYSSGSISLSHLPSLIRVNVFNALYQNATILGLDTAWLLYDSVSPFGRSGPATAEEATLAARPHPATLQPTALQRAVPHHPWLDLFPLPQLRDNFLRAIENPDVCDEDLLCFDLVEFGDEGEAQSASLIVWGEPWDPRGWEASTRFLKKWGWLLAGCPEILEGTNYWREKRGEKRLVFRT